MIPYLSGGDARSYQADGNAAGKGILFRYFLACTSDFRLHHKRAGGLIKNIKDVPYDRTGYYPGKRPQTVWGGAKRSWVLMLLMVMMMMMVVVVAMIMVMVMVMLMVMMMMMMMMMMMRPAFCASLRSRNAHGHVTRGIFAEIYRENAVHVSRDQCFVRACAVEMHMDMLQEAFCAEIYRKSAGRFRYHLRWTPAVNSYCKNPSVWPHCLGKKQEDRRGSQQQMIWSPCEIAEQKGNCGFS